MKTKTPATPLWERAQEAAILARNAAVADGKDFRECDRIFHATYAAKMDRRHA